MEVSSRRRLLDPLGHGRKDCSLARQGLAPLSFTIQCQPTASKKWYPFKETEHYIREFPLAEENPFKVDLRIQGIPQNTVLQDQRRMTKIRGLVNKLRTEYRTESVITDLNKTGEFNKLSEESKMTVQRLGKIELYGLGEVSKKTQCPSCAK